MTKRVASATRRIHAPAAVIFEQIADPALQPAWDGNDNLVSSPSGHRVRAVGDVFSTLLTSGNTRENHVVAFREGRELAWRPANPGQDPAGHQWEWHLEPVDATTTDVTHVYDWRELTDPARIARAQATTPERLDASIARLAALVEAV